MKRILLITLFSSLYLIAFSQAKKVDWKTVQVFEFTHRLGATQGGLPDSLELCGGEWFVEGYANTLAELDAYELETIKKKVADYGCDIVFVDVRKVYTPIKGQLYILGVRKK